VNNNIVACKRKNGVISTNIDSCRNIGYILGDFVNHFYCPTNALNYTNLEVKIYVV